MENSSSNTTTPTTTMEIITNSSILSATTTEGNNTTHLQPLVYYPEKTLGEKIQDVAVNTMILVNYWLIVPAFLLIFISLKNWLKRMGLISNGDVRQLYDAVELTNKNSTAAETTSGKNDAASIPLHSFIKLAK